MSIIIKRTRLEEKKKIKKKTKRENFVRNMYIRLALKYQKYLIDTYKYTLNLLQETSLLF